MENKIRKAIEIALSIREKRCETREEKDALAELANFAEEVLEAMK